MELRFNKKELEEIMNHSKTFLLASIFVLSLLACNFLNQTNTPERPINSQTQLPESESPQTPTASTYATSISVGSFHACAVLNTGYLTCWGDNSAGQLGDGTYTKHNMAFEIDGLTGIASVSAGGVHTCTLLQTGSVKCWGDNTSRQLGNGDKGIFLQPTDVTDLSNVKEISAGGEHTCALLNNGNVKCWGANFNGRVGNNTTERIIPLPVDVFGIDEEIIYVSAGGEHTCAIAINGNVKCWGRNTTGELGIGNDLKLSKTPMDVVELEDKAIALSTSYPKSCAVTDKGKIKCWGWVLFDLFSNSPVSLGNLQGTPTSIATGLNHICVLDANEEVWCIGENQFGQLGDGTTIDRQNFIKVKNLPNNIISIEAGYQSTCVLTEVGEVWCWGDNTTGQLGNGTNENSTLPVMVVGINQ